MKILEAYRDAARLLLRLLDGLTPKPRYVKRYQSRADWLEQNREALDRISARIQENNRKRTRLGLMP